MHREIYHNENSGGKTTISVEGLENGTVQLFWYDIGTDAKRTYGDSDVEKWLAVDSSEVQKLAVALLADRYVKDPDAIQKFKDFCEQNSIKFSEYLWT